MTTGTTGKILLILATAFLSSTLTALWMSPSDPMPPVEQQAIDLSGLNALTERIDALIGALTFPSVRSPSDARTAALPEDRTPLEDGSGPSIAASLEKIRALLQAQVYQQQTQSGGLAGVSMRYPDADWFALETLKGRLNQNRDAVSRSQMFLTPPEVLESYGRPTRITPYDKETRWRYQRTRENEPTLTITFYFRDGYVYQVR